MINISLAHLSDKSCLFSDIALFAFLTARYRGSHTGVFYKKGVFKNFTKFTGDELCRSVFFNKVEGWRSEATLQMFSCKFCEILENILERLLL